MICVIFLTGDFVALEGFCFPILKFYSENLSFALRESACRGKTFGFMILVALLENGPWVLARRRKTLCNRERDGRHANAQSPPAPKWAHGKTPSAFASTATCSQKYCA